MLTNFCRVSTFGFNLSQLVSFEYDPEAELLVIYLTRGLPVEYSGSSAQFMFEKLTSPETQIQDWTPKTTDLQTQRENNAKELLHQRAENFAETLGLIQNLDVMDSYHTAARIIDLFEQARSETFAIANTEKTDPRRAGDTEFLKAGNEENHERTKPCTCGIHSTGAWCDKSCCSRSPQECN